VINFLQGSAVAQTVLGGLTITSSCCRFPIVHVCQKICKLCNSRQSYCNNKGLIFFGSPCINKPGESELIEVVCTLTDTTCSSPHPTPNHSTALYSSLLSQPFSQLAKLASQPGSQVASQPVSQPAGRPAS